MKIKQTFWLRIALINLFVVALLGTVMRYKIGWSFPWLDQRHLQHAHSHFAFTGWITHTFFVLIAGVLSRDQPLLNMSKYRTLIAANLVCAYAMLASFLWQGYGAVSITFSTLSVIILYIYAGTFFAGMHKGPQKTYNLWFTAGLWFAIISSLGTFTLAWMMATHNYSQKLYLASLYFFLHFQYNGFFLFACAGLLFSSLAAHNIHPTHQRRVFWIFCIACVPAYLLSVLWLKLPVWLLLLTAIAALAQVYGWALLLRGIYPSWRARAGIFRGAPGIVFFVVGAAISVKYLLQLGSTIPEVSHIAFGFRHIVIAYLHLVLLAIVSAFILGYIYTTLPSPSKFTLFGLIVIIAGIYFNQAMLGVQGIASLTYTYLGWTEPALLAAAIVIMIGGLMMWLRWPREVAIR